MVEAEYVGSAAIEESREVAFVEQMGILRPVFNIHQQDLTDFDVAPPHRLPSTRNLE